MSILTSILDFQNAGRAAHSISDANIAAEHGVLNATDSAQQRIDTALGNAKTSIPAAGQTAIGLVNDATKTANEGLTGAQTGFENLKAGTTGTYSPYMDAGSSSTKQLTDLLGAGPDKFSFNYDDYKNDPAFKFQMDQGNNAIQNSAAAKGLLSGGGVLKDLTTFGQGLAATHYQDAFNRAQSSFNTNQTAKNSLLSNLQDLSGRGLTAGNAYTDENRQLQTGIGNLEQSKSGNTVTGGLFGGTTTTDLAKFLASLDLQGNTTAGQQGIAGSKLAGDYAVGAGEAHAGGIAGQGAALDNAINFGVNGLGDLFKTLGLGG